MARGRLRQPNGRLAATMSNLRAAIAEEPEAADKLKLTACLKQIEEVDAKNREESKQPRRRAPQIEREEKASTSAPSSSGGNPPFGSPAWRAKYGR